MWLLDTSGSEEEDFQIFFEARRRNGNLKMFCFISDVMDAPIARKPAQLNGSKLDCAFNSSLVGGVAEAFLVGYDDQSGLPPIDTVPDTGGEPH